MRRPILLGLLTVTLATGAGVVTALAVSGSSTSDPTSTTTINIAATGPQGPPGPPGPAGEFSCGTGFHVGLVVFVQQGEGPTTVKTCVKD
jgi:hypothetical protein